MERGYRLQFENRLAKVEQSHQADIEKLQKEYQRQLQLQQEKKDALYNEYQDELRELERQTDAAIRKMDMETTRKLELQREELLIKLQKQQLEFEAQIRVLQKRQREEMQIKFSQLEERIAEVSNQFDRDEQLKMAYANKCMEEANRCVEAAKNEVVQEYSPEEFVILTSQLCEMTNAYYGNHFSAAAAQAIAVQFDSKRCINTAQQKAAQYEYWMDKLRDVYQQIDELLEGLEHIPFQIGRGNHYVDARRNAADELKRLRDAFRAEYRENIESCQRKSIDVLQLILINTDHYDDDIEAVRVIAVQREEANICQLYTAHILKEAFQHCGTRWQNISVNRIEEMTLLQAESDDCMCLMQVQVHCTYSARDKTRNTSITFHPQWLRGIDSKVKRQYIHQITNKLAHDLAHSPLFILLSPVLEYIDHEGRETWETSSTDKLRSKLLGQKREVKLRNKIVEKESEMGQRSSY